MSRLGSGVPLIARRDELAELRTALERAADGEPGAVLLGGDAGVGKSRLLRELTEDAVDAGALVLTGRCVDIGEAGLPYLAFAEAFGGLDGADLEAARRLPALGRVLPALGMPERVGPVPVGARPTPGAMPEQDIGQLQLFEAVLALLAELSSRRTVLLALEDLHWADSSTRNLLSLLVSRLRSGEGGRILLLGTFRTDDMHRRHPLRPLLAELVRLPVVQRIDLTPLAVPEVRALIDALVVVPGDVAQRLAERAEGNPFFAEELAAAAGGGVDPRCELPAALADVLLARIERLGADTQRLLRLVSVGGRHVGHERLQAVATREAGGDDDPDIEEPLREAIAHHVLLTDEHGRYQFRHALLREAVYADLLPGERVRLHTRYVERIAAEPHGRGTAAALAHHSIASNALVTALSASVAAADEAADLGAPATALAHAEQALKLWDAVSADARPDGVRLADLVRRASYLAATSGEVERAISYARLAITEADALADVEASVRARHRLMDSLSAVDGHDEEIREVAEQAWRLVEHSPPGRQRTWILARRAAVLRPDDNPGARASARLAIEESRQLAGVLDVVAAEADALTTLALIDDSEGAEEAAREHLTHAVQVARRAGSASTQLRATYYLSLHCHDRGRLAEGLALATDGLAAAAEHGLSWSTFGIELRVLLIVLASGVGEWDLADEHASIQAGRPESSIVGARIAAASTMVSLGRGRFEETGAQIDRLRGHWHRDVQVPLFAGCSAIELELWRGGPRDAVRRAAELWEWSQSSDRCMRISAVRIGALTMAAYLATGEAGDRRAAEDMYRRIEDIAVSATVRTGKPGPEALAWLAVARAQHTGDAASWAEAVRAFGYGDVYRQAVLRLRYAEALLGDGDRTGCAHELQAAYRSAVDLGARPLVDALTALAGRARIDLGAGTAAPAGELLTPREHSVLELVAAGRTNKQVGEALFISEKTVSVHLSRAMGKLGVGRRAEAVAAAYDRGLLQRQS